MVVRDIQHIVELWAPRELCWEGDNAGLQAGSPLQAVKKILITLDVTEQVIAEARRKNANLIISHHPLIFTPLKSLTPQTRTGSLLLSLVENKIALLSAHTNLDFTQNGVSFALAAKLGLRDVKVLIPQDDVLNKIVVFVPHPSSDAVMNAMAKAGAGVIGKYDSCSFRSEGIGTFRGLEGSSPVIGSPGVFEQTEEARLEMIVPSWKLSEVLKAMKEHHPYEEIACDVYPLRNQLNSMGAGAIGFLQKAISLETFLGHIQTALSVPSLRYTGKKKSLIRRVAVCGGSGSQGLSSAIAAGADAYITADIKYHTFQDAENRIALIDAGHFETEEPILTILVSYLKQQLSARSSTIPVLVSSSLSNPVHYFIT